MQQLNSEQKERLEYVLARRHSSALIFIEFDKLSLREDLLQWMQQSFTQYHHYVLDLTSVTVESLHRTMSQLLPDEIRKSETATFMVHVKGLENSYHRIGDDTESISPLIAQLNFERELLFQKIPYITVIYTSGFFINKLQQQAMDLWHWVVYYYPFVSEAEAEPVAAKAIEYNDRPVTDEQRRKVAELQEELSAVVLSHPPTERELRGQLNIYEQLAKINNEIYDLDQVIFYYEKGLHNATQLYGEENESVARFYNQLGSAFHDKGDLDKAIEYYNKALQIDLKLFGEENPNVAIRYNNLATAFQDKGDLDKAIDYFNKALQLNLKLFGEENPKVAIRYNNLGATFKAKGDLDKAIEYFNKALQIDLKVLGEENPSVAIRYNNLGSAFKAQGDLDKAIEYYNKALQIDLKVLGEENPNIAIDYNNLGSSFRAQGDLDKAIEYYNKALQIDVKLFGEENPNVAIPYNNLGLAFKAKGDLEKAIELLKKSYSILRSTYGEDNPTTKRVKGNLDDAIADKEKKK